MYSFPELIKRIREEADMTQAEFARAIGVSSILIAMVESKQKEVSKGLIIKLADKLKVHPTSITPFLFTDSDVGPGMERGLLDFGRKMQRLLIEKKARNL